MKILNIISNNLWIIATILILIMGLYFTFKLKFLQFNFRKMFSSMFKKDNKKTGINSFKTLMLALAGRIGVGSISGIALAIYIGGAGTLFWIWFISLLSATLAYAETYLGIKYKEKDGDVYKGGPAYYLKKGLNRKILGGIYALMIILAYVIGYMSIQANTIVKSVTSIININQIFIGLALSILSFIVIFGGIKKISNATSKIVPFMSVIYVGLSIIIIISNINLIPNILKSIISSAFNIKSAGVGIFTTFIIGVQRGIFSNEGGMGTGSIAASSGNSDNPIKEGYIQMLGIYITSFLICTATSLIILTTNYKTLLINDPNGIEIASYAFTTHLGSIGNIILVICIFMFAFSTILTGYYYGESSLKYFFKNPNKKFIFLLKIFTLIMIFIGSISSSTLIWKITDIFTALLVLINIYALNKLKKEIKS